MIDGSRGYLKVYADKDDPYLIMKAGSRVNLDFDHQYIPFFTVGLNAHQGKVEGEFYAELRYKEKYSIPGSGYIYNYYDSEKAEDDFDLSVID